VSLDELLADGGFEGLEVLGCRGLAHAADVGGSGDGALPADLDQQP
jgi:hypothetical protein